MNGKRLLEKRIAIITKVHYKHAMNREVNALSAGVTRESARTESIEDYVNSHLVTVEDYVDLTSALKHSVDRYLS